MLLLLCETLAEWDSTCCFLACGHHLSLVSRKTISNKEDFFNFICLWQFFSKWVPMKPLAYIASFFIYAFICVEIYTRGQNFWHTSIKERKTHNGLWNNLILMKVIRSFVACQYTFSKFQSCTFCQQWRLPRSSSIKSPNSNGWCDLTLMYLDIGVYLLCL